MHSLRACALAVLGVTLALAGENPAPENLTGTWIGTIPQNGRSPARDVAFRLHHAGSVLRGKVYNDSGFSDAITQGSVSDAGIAFDVEAMEQAGNQINVVVYQFRAALEGDELAVTRERAAARDSVSGADIPVRRPNDSDEEDRARRFQTFRLERLYR